MDERCLCPTGWYIPSDGEWTELEKFLGGPRVAGGSLKSTQMKPTVGGWESPNEKAVDDVGFGARPGGAPGQRRHLLQCGPDRHVVDLHGQPIQNVLVPRG